MTDPILTSLDSLPKASDIYLWCDFIEIRCLVHPDKRFSRQDFIEVIDDSSAAGICVTPENDSEYSESEDDDAELLLTDESMSSDPPEEEDDPAHLLPVSDKSEALASNLFGNLRARETAFDDSYPFMVSASGQELSLRDPLSPRQILYLELLLSSSLRLIPKTRRKELTDPFERLSTEIFKALMPAGWEVHQFGAQTGTRYRGHLSRRIEMLATDWRGKHLLAKMDYKATNAGDSGLDIVAWHPLGDDRQGIPLAAAQCGCTATEWQLKQLEASPAMLGGKLWTLHPWATYYFMPQDLTKWQNGSSTWQRRDSLARAIVIDRLRLVRLANQYGIDKRFLSASKALADAKSMSVT